MRTRGGEGVASAAFDRANRNAVCARTKHPFDHIRLNDVESRVPWSVGANIINLVRGFSRTLESHSHRLPQSENFIGGIAITLRAIPGDLEVRGNPTRG